MSEHWLLHFQSAASSKYYRMLKGRPLICVCLCVCVTCDFSAPTCCKRKAQGAYQLVYNTELSVSSPRTLL